MSTSNLSVFETMHSRLNAVFKLHQHAILSYAWPPVSTTLAAYSKLLQTHIDLEDHWLIPIFERAGKQRYWPASTFLAEHRKITALLERHQQQLAISFADPRDRVLATLDSARRLAHLIEHHHQREDSSLFPTVLAEASQQELAGIHNDGTRAWSEASLAVANALKQAEKDVEESWLSLGVC